MKEPFDVRSAIRKLRKAVEPYPKAALFELVTEKFDSVFEVLVACIISIRTRDETTIPVAKQLFARARTPKRYWVEINALLVPFGKHVCTAKLPKCSTCPLLSMCRQVGVTTHR